MSDIKHMVTGAAKYAAGRLFMKDNNLSHSRVEVCNSCEQLTPSRQCSICLCKVDQKAKFAGEYCPLTQVIGVRQDGTYERLYLRDKWGGELSESVPHHGYARLGDVVIHPTHERAINVRTKQETTIKDQRVHISD